jgi:GxxExxY protein
MNMEQLSEAVIGMAIAIHRKMGSGFCESVYHRCLEIELAAAGIHFESKVPLDVFYQGKLVGKFESDMIITTDDLRLLIELKACEAIHTAHEAQIVNYLTATGIDDGLLLNFGARKIEVRHKYRLYRPRATKHVEPFDLH